MVRSVIVAIVICKCFIGQIVNAQAEGTDAHQIDRALSNPAFIKLPQGIPSMQIVDLARSNRRIRIFPMGVYTESYFFGWNAFLADTANGKGKLSAVERVVPDRTTWNEWQVRGLAAGARDCRTAIMTLLNDGVPQSKICEHAKKLIASESTPITEISTLEKWGLDVPAPQLMASSPRSNSLEVSRVRCRRRFLSFCE